MAVFRRRQMLLLNTQATYQSLVLGIAPASLIAYWPLTETSGTTASDVSGNARHGTYSGVTLAQITGPGQSMGSAGLWDGVNDLTNVFSASLATAFNPDAFTVAIWAKTTLAIWGDGSLHSLFSYSASASNYILIYKSTVANQVIYEHRRGASVKQTTLNGVASADWLHFGLTVDKTADEMKAYYQGAQTGATNTGLAAWTGALVQAALGVNIAGGSFWSGYLAHSPVWSTALTPTQITLLATAR